MDALRVVEQRHSGCFEFELRFSCDLIINVSQSDYRSIAGLPQEKTSQLAIRQLLRQTRSGHPIQHASRQRGSGIQRLILGRVGERHLAKCD